MCIRDSITTVAGIGFVRYILPHEWPAGAYPALERLADRLEASAAFTAVSYTHLDVYKRQGIGIVRCAVGQPRCAGSRHVDRAKMKIGRRSGGRFREGYPGQRPDVAENGCGGGSLLGGEHGQYFAGVLVDDLSLIHVWFQVPIV